MCDTKGDGDGCQLAGINHINGWADGKKVDDEDKKPNKVLIIPHVLTATLGVGHRYQGTATI